MNAHFPIGPTPKIGDRKALQERVCLDKLLSFGPAGCIGTRHDGGRAGFP
jgi:hypothetical protein